MQLADACQPIPVVFLGLAEAVPALVPAVAQQDFDLIFTGVKRDLIGLILDPGVVVAEPGKEALVPLLFAVYVQLIEAHARQVHPAAGNRFGDGPCLEYRHLHFLRGTGGDPVRLPFSALGGLKPCRRTFRRFSVVRPDTHLPEVTGLRLQIDGQGKRGADDGIYLAAVIEESGKILIQ